MVNEEKKKFMKVSQLIIMLVVVLFVFFIGKATYSNDGTVGLSDIFDYSLNVDGEKKIISSITKNTKISELLSKVNVSSDNSISSLVIDSNGNEKNRTSVINSGDMLKIKLNDKEEIYGLSVIADINGDSNVSLTDLSILRKYISKNEINRIPEGGVYYYSADINGDGNLTLTDLSKIRKMIAGIEEIISVKLNMEEVKLNVNETKKLDYTVYPSDVSDKSVSWTSSNNKVVIIKDGVVQAVGVGEAIVTVTTNNSKRKDDVKFVISDVSEEIFEQIKPTGTENIIFKEYKDTLKVWIEETIRNDGGPSYYTTHLWVKDAYNQLKTQVPDNFGKELNVAKELFEKAIEQHKFENKLIVGVNASAIVAQNSWNNDIFVINNGYNNSAFSPLVIVNGVEKRDLTADEVLPWYSHTYGLTKSGDLNYYEYTKRYTEDFEANEKRKQKNVKVTEKIREDEVKNTFAFWPELVINGVKDTDDTNGTNRLARAPRQAICQIDKNNFVFITDKNNGNRNGFSLDDLSEYMIVLGCKTGLNLDGGGSNALLYKSSTNNDLTVVTTSNRLLADIIYFHE